MSLEIVQPKDRLEGGGGAGGKIGEGGQHCGSRKVTSVVCQFLFLVFCWGRYVFAGILSSCQLLAVLALLFLFLYTGLNGYPIPARYPYQFTTQCSFENHQLSDNMKFPV